MKLILNLEKPISGYWDYGQKSRFEFSLNQNHIGQDSKGQFIKVDCFDANYWFNVAYNPSLKVTLANIKRRFAKKLSGIKHNWEYIE
jgi:hypothetical protein